MSKKKEESKKPLSEALVKIEEILKEYNENDQERILRGALFSFAPRFMHLNFNGN